MSETPRPTRATCVCCRNLGVLPDTGTRELYDAVSGQMLPVLPGQTVAGEVVLQMCDQCTVAAFLDSTQPHPHQMSRSIR